MWRIFAEKFNKKMDNHGDLYMPITATLLITHTENKTIINLQNDKIIKVLLRFEDGRKDQVLFTGDSLILNRDK